MGRNRAEVPNALDGVLDAFVEAAAAGACAMQLIGRAFIETKGDGTPHAAADGASDRAIHQVLSHRLPGLPIVSEENPGHLPAHFADGRFVLVDPLDGTREFLEGHPDHAVCIALIERRRPVAGVILAPVQAKAWIAGEDAREYDLDPDYRPILESARVLCVDKAREKAQRLVTSRSRPDPLAQRMYPDLAPSSIKQMGAVLKLVAIARGDACVFPTSNPSAEWDIAAGEALVRAAGGVMSNREGKRLIYGRKRNHFRHEPYVAACNRMVLRQALAQWPAS
jgi:3'(2'), 5'-bisphosphate nucleotidase